MPINAYAEQTEKINWLIKKTETPKSVCIDKLCVFGPER